jgi:glycosyltransferase involved in cell wall biosynthesis
MREGELYLQRPLVSVVVPVYNGERFLAEALGSIRDQDYREFEIIVVDDGSTDGSADVARFFNGVRYVFQSNQGVASAWNGGLAASQGELVAFLAQDDLWTRDKLSTQVGYMLAHPEIRYTVARAKYFLEPGCTVPPGFRIEMLDGDHLARIVESMVARKEVFDIVGGFDTSLNTTQDIDWFARAKDAHVPMGVISRVLLHRRIHDGNLTYSLGSECCRDVLAVVRKSIRRQRDQGDPP